MESEKEINQSQESMDSDQEELFHHSKKSRKSVLIDSDDDELPINDDKNGNSDHDTSIAVDKNNHSDDGNSTSDELFDQPDSSQKRTRKAIFLDSDEENENVLPKQNQSSEKQILQKDLHESIERANTSSDSDSDRNSNHENETSDDEEREENPTLDMQKRQSKPQRASSEKARLAMAKEIHSESQRMLRNTEISLPYHRPKQRTLEEFLNRRKAHKNNVKSLKLSMKDPELLRELDESKKDIDEFYKSESDSDHENDKEICEDVTEVDNTFEKLSSATQSEHIDSINDNETKLSENIDTTSKSDSNMDTPNLELPELSDTNCDTGNTESMNLKLTEFSEVDCIAKSPQQSPMRKKFDRLQSKFCGYDVNELMNVTPKIQRPGNFVDLGDVKSDKKSNADFDELLNRLVKTSTKKKVCRKEAVNLDIISKEKDGNGEEQLVTSTVTVNVEDDTPLQHEVSTPGAQLAKLKTSLKAQLIAQRETERLRRIQEKQFLDKEEFIAEYDDDLPAEEVEMSESEIETESEPEENDIPMVDKAYKDSTLLDNEAFEDCEDDLDNIEVLEDREDDLDNAEVLEDREDDLDNAEVHSNASTEELSDNEVSEESEDDVTNVAGNARKANRVLDDSDNEVDCGEPDSSDFHLVLDKCDTASKLQFNSEDLFSSDKPLQQQISIDEDTCFPEEESLLDPNQPNTESESLLAVKSDHSEFNDTALLSFNAIPISNDSSNTEKKNTSLNVSLSSINLSETQKMPTDGNSITSPVSNESLFGLCPGKDNSEIQNTSDSMKEILQFCSNVNFVTPQPISEEKLDSSDEEMPTTTQKVIVESDDDSLSTMNDRKRKRRVFTLSDAESDSEEFIPKKKFTGFKDKVHGGFRQEFLEAEAELSGSDIDSGDEIETEDQDLMEQEEGDLEQFDQEELRNEVGKTHMKRLIDSDKRELRLLQELYLEDGDLHGEGRQRKFRWKNVDKDHEMSISNVSDEGASEDENEEESQRRLQRYEREKFLAQATTKEEEPLFTDSSIKVVVNSKKTITTVLQQNNTNQLPETPFHSFSSKSKCGSFLARGKNNLQKIAESTKENKTTIGGANQKGNFVFQTISVEERDRQIAEASKKKKKVIVKSTEARLKRSFSNLDESQKSASIFNHF